MKSAILVLTSIVLMTVGLPVHGQLLADEFDYPASDLLSAHGWTVYETATIPVTVVSGSLSYTGYSSGIGNSVTITQSFDLESVKRSFASQTSGSVYVSFLLNVESALPSSSFVGSSQVVQVGPAGMDSDPNGVRLYVYSDQGKVLFGITKTGSQLPLTAADYDFNTPILIVLKYTFNPTLSNDDWVYLFVNPAMGGAEPTPTLPMSSGAPDATDIAEVGIRGNDYDPDGSDETRFILDAIRVGTSWPSASSSLIFQDGFESNDTTAWSSTTP